MLRRHFLQLAAAAAPSRPNLLIITNDQHRADSLGCMGNPVIQTPHTDRLAAQGALFLNHFVQAPQCVPSRVSLATGRYPHVHRTPSNAYKLFPDELTLAQILNSAGYRTAAVGEMPFAPQSETGGFTQILASGRHHAALLQQNGWKREPSQAPFQAAPVPWPASLDESNFYAQTAIEFLQQPHPAPFYLHINFRRPHHPFDPPKPYDTLYANASFPPSHSRRGEFANKPPQQQLALKNSVGFDLTTLTPQSLNDIKRLYYGMVTLNDEAIGKVLAALHAQRLDQNTIVVFHADHGEMLGDHGLLFKGGYMYDEVVKVPLIIRAPGKVQPGARINHLVETVDILPTLLDLMGLPIPLGVQGVNLFTGKPKQAVFAEFPTIKMVRTKDWKLVHYPNAKHGELYDLNNDPHELTNLWPDPAHAPAKARMLALLSDWLIQSQDPKRSPSRLPSQ
jgi:arylsulfatase A-like enzyme